MSMGIGWYARRLRHMSAGEVLGRTVDHSRHALWARRQVPPGATAPPAGGLREFRGFGSPLPASARVTVPDPVRAETLAAADRILAGDLAVLGVPRPDLADPDWFLDPASGTRAPQGPLAFRIDHRDEQVTGNVKLVWELSRHHHLTVLACAYWLTGEDAYAEAVAHQLGSWWEQNPFLSGVHWTSGIELGVRLIGWAWVRRFLHDWPKVGDLFETNEAALRQLRWHQEYLAAFGSRKSSANNHAVAEDCGRLVAARAFPWFDESDTWARDASERLGRHLRTNTFPSGINREQATDYHRFVTELALLAVLEDHAAGQPTDPEELRLLAASADAAAALLDVAGRPPRQGDGDEGRALVLTDPDADSWSQLLGLAEGVLGRQDWWPVGEPTMAGLAAAALAPRTAVGGRVGRRPDTFPDAGLTLLRTRAGETPEIWCRCDGGPHGFGSIAAHGHADALSVEVRVDGVEILVDPGTYCYHGEPAWRSYFRSTRAHNTLEIDGANQSVEGGPFLWSTQARTRVLREETGDRDLQVWQAEHEGYARLDASLRHRRTVTLNRRCGLLLIDDDIAAGGEHLARLYFHLGPDVRVEVDRTLARLEWSTHGSRTTAELWLPPQLTWTTHRGETDPVLGWYSPRFGQRQPSTTLVGRGVVETWTELETCLDLGPSGMRGSDG